MIINAILFSFLFISELTLVKQLQTTEYTQTSKLSFTFFFPGLSWSI